MTDSISFQQVALRDRPQQVADVLNAFASQPAIREDLPNWQAKPDRTVGHS